MRVTSPILRKRYRTVLNETFAATGRWSVPTGLAISSGTLNKTEATGTSRVATIDLGLVMGAAYRTTFTVGARSAGSIRLDVGRDATLSSFGGAGTGRTANGTYTETIICGVSSLLSATFGATANTNITADNLIVERV